MLVGGARVGCFDDGIEMLIAAWDNRRGVEIAVSVSLEGALVHFGQGFKQELANFQRG